MISDTRKIEGKLNLQGFGESAVELETYCFSDFDSGILLLKCLKHATKAKLEGNKALEFL